MKILEAGTYSASSTCSISPFLSESEIFLQEESIPARNQLHDLGIDYEISILLSIEAFLKSYRTLH